ncbi:diphthine synthase [Candidatus Woesearchaeota archaeon]|nr:diphthine synthase [Candidatus Woesearchaeota archaeon]
MTLYFIGLGLGDEKDISVKGLDAIKKSELVFLESYTSLLGIKEKELEKFYNKKIILADRNLVEKEAEKILEPAKDKDVAFLVVGDPFGATTHTDLFLRAKEKGINVEIIHNASIMNAVGEVGLELYKYGKTTSIPYWEKNFEPETPYDVIKMNKANGLHTLCLLDIKADKERFMTVNEGLQILKKIEDKRKEKVITDNLLVIGVARIGQDNQVIKVGTIKELENFDFGGQLHSLIIPGKLQIVEEEALEIYKK